MGFEPRNNVFWFSENSFLLNSSRFIVMCCFGFRNIYEYVFVILQLQLSIIPFFWYINIYFSVIYFCSSLHHFHTHFYRPLPMRPYGPAADLSIYHTNSSQFYTRIWAAMGPSYVFWFYKIRMVSFYLPMKYSGSSLPCLCALFGGLMNQCFLLY